MAEETEKVYITRDSNNDHIWVWRKPDKGTWIPKNMSEEKDSKNFQREDRDLSRTSYYFHRDFKKKFGVTLSKGTKKCIHLPVKLLNDETYMCSTYDYQ